ncbi:MAG: peptidylprolyl isomerase [Planctomycetota bacterium]|jgi:parvulin-like peptidyl-prolyl isomerase
MSALEREELEIQRKREALQALVERHLLYEAARERYMQGPSTEKALDRIVEQELEKFEARVGSKLKAMQLFSDLGLSVEDYKELQRQNILGAKLLWDEVHARVHVMPSEARAYYDERRDEFSIPRTVVYRQILFAVVDEEEESAQREQAASVLEELRGGADFAELARRHSADCEEHAGGLHEVAIPEDCADWMPPAVEGLTPGQVSDVRTVAGGFAIVKLEEVRPPRVPPFEEVQGAIKAALIERKRAEAQAEFIEELKQKAQIEYYPAGRRLGL